MEIDEGNDDVGAAYEVKGEGEAEGRLGNRWRRFYRLTPGRSPPQARLRRARHR